MPPLPGVGRELLGEARLADPRLADDREEPSSPRDHVFHPGVKLAISSFAPEE